MTSLPATAEPVATMPLAALEMRNYVSEMYAVELHCASAPKAEDGEGLNDKALTDHAEAALLGIFEGFLRCLRTTGPRRAALTEHYGNRMFQEMGAVGGERWLGQVAS